MQLGLFHVVHVKVEVTEGMDESARLKSADLGDHHGEERVGSDIEGHTEEKIGASLVELAIKFPILNKKLK